MSSSKNLSWMHDKDALLFVVSATVFLISGMMYYLSDPGALRNSNPSPSLKLAEGIQSHGVSSDSGSAETHRPVAKIKVSGPLVENTWTWEYEGVEPRTLKFLADGTLLQTRFIGTYAPESQQVITVSKKGELETARLTFSDDYSSYVGTDFDGKRKIWGYAVTLPPQYSAEREEQLDAFITKYEWTWERPTSPPGIIKFEKNGSVTYPYFEGTWSVQDNTILLTFKGRTATLIFDPLRGGWHGFENDSKKLIWGRLVSRRN